MKDTKKKLSLKKETLAAVSGGLFHRTTLRCHQYPTGSCMTCYFTCFREAELRCSDGIECTG